jgi:Na+-driven multidrug efflux pump
MTLTVSLLVVSVPGTLLRIFTPDPIIIGLGSDYLRIVGICYVFFAVMFVSNGVINGAGQTFITTIISLISLWVVRVPLALYLAHRLGAVTGVWYAIAVSFAVSMLSSLVYYFTGRWRRSVIRHGPAPVTETSLFGEQTGEA